MSASVDARRRALASLAGEDPSFVRAPLDLSGLSPDDRQAAILTRLGDIQSDDTSASMAQHSGDDVVPPGTFPPVLNHPTSLGPEYEQMLDVMELAKLKRKPAPPPSPVVAAGGAPPPLDTSITVDGSGAGSVPGVVREAMTGAGLPTMPRPGETPAPRPFESISGAAPEEDDNGIPAAVRQYVAAQQDQGPSEAQQLQDAQDKQRLLQLYAGLGHAGATIGAAIGHIGVDEGFWRDLSAQTGQPVEALKARLGLKHQQEAQDPASEVNAKARALWAGQLPDLAKLPGWDLATKDEIPKLIESAHFREQLAARQQALEAAGKERIAGRDLDERRLAETERHNRASESRPVGVPQGAAPGAATFVAPGYSLSPGSAPSKFELGQFRASLAARDQILQDVKELRQMYKEHGTELYGDTARRMAARVSDLKLKVKDLASLGALSGSDLALLTAQIPDPTSLGANVKGALGMDTSGAGFGEFEKIITGALDAKRQALGIIAAPTETSAAGLNLDDPDGGAVRVISPSGQTGTIPKAKLQDALTRGFRLVPT